MAAVRDAAYYRELGRKGGQATAAKGSAYMSQIGKRGFKVALALGYGEVLSRKLGGSYEAKYGRSLVISPATVEANRIRAEARRMYAGMPCDVTGCNEPAEVHHIHGIGIENPNADSNIALLCKRHHIAQHRAIRAAHKAQR